MVDRLAPLSIRKIAVGFAARTTASSHTPESATPGCMRHVSRAGLATLLTALFAVAAPAQDLPIVQSGDAVVTGFSGVAQMPAPVGASSEDYAIINRQGSSLQVFDLSRMGGPNDGRLVAVPRRFLVTADRIGQVFGVTLDDGHNPGGGERAGNIYATATSAFGLNLIREDNGVVTRARTGGPDRRWMSGQFPAHADAGPGSIWKINGQTGEVSLFATAALDGVKNTGPGLGNIAFDTATRVLFVSDLQTGMIHAFNLDGRQIGVYDHGASARPLTNVPPVEFDPKGRVEITSPDFDTTDPATWGFADPARRVWGLAAYDRRLFYSVAEGPEIWSVGLGADGKFLSDPQIEVRLPAANTSAISKIAFGRDGTMYLGQRGAIAASYDHKVLAKGKSAAVLRYKPRKLSNGQVIWQPLPDEYAVGFKSGYRNANGGIALGFGYDRNGDLRQSSCQGTLWSTGESLRVDPLLEDRLLAGGPTIVHGLQGNALDLIRPANEGPFKSYFVDFDSSHMDPENGGHMGDIAIWSRCLGNGVTPITVVPDPTGPLVSIAKSCSAALFGNTMQCRVSVSNTGSAIPQGPVGFTDLTDTLSESTGAPPLILQATGDDLSWTCSGLPATDVTCSISGAAIKPGQTRYVDVVMDLSSVLGTVGWQVRNCAILDGTRQTACATRGEDDALFVVKSGPVQQTCIAGGPCDFELSIHNPGNRPHDGNLVFGDDLTIGGGLANSVTVDGIWPTHGCAISAAALPARWQCHLSIPPRGFKTFNILLTLPAAAAGQGLLQGRNCFFATPPGLASTAGALVQTPGASGYTPSQDCVGFTIDTGTPPIRVPTLPEGPKLLLSSEPVPNVFGTAGETITYTYTVMNTGTAPVSTFTLLDDKATGIVCQPGSTGPTTGPLAAGASVRCTGTYTVTSADVGQAINSTASAVGLIPNGPVDPPAPVANIVLYQAPGTTQPTPPVTTTPRTGTAPTTPGTGTVTTTPATGTTTGGTTTGSKMLTDSGLTIGVQSSIPAFHSAGEVITYDYVLTNTGKDPITGLSMSSKLGAKITCPPPGQKGHGPVGHSPPPHNVWSGKLEPGEWLTCRAIYTVKMSDMSGPIKDPVTVLFQTAGTKKLRTAVGVLELPLEKKAAVHLQVIAQQKTFSVAGEKIYFQYKITNSGSVRHDNFAVLDERATGILCLPTGDNTGGPLEPGQSQLCVGEIVVKQSDFGKPLSNNGRVRAGLKTATKLSDIVEHKDVKDVVQFVAKPHLKVELAPYSKTFYKAGQEVPFTYTVTNTGSAPIGFLLNDLKIALTCFPVPRPNTLAPGQKTTCTGSYITTQKDVDKGKVVWEYYLHGDSVEWAKEKTTLTSGTTPKFTCRQGYAPHIMPGHPNGGYCVFSHLVDVHDKCIKNTPAATLAVIPHFCENKGAAIPGRTPQTVCPDNDENCKLAQEMCGTLEPKRFVRDAGSNDWRLDQFNPFDGSNTLNYSIAGKGLAAYEPWYTGCRGNSWFAKSHGQIFAANICASNPETCYTLENRNCDIFCSKNVAKVNCDASNPLMVNEVPASDNIPNDPTTSQPATQLMVCPWKISGAQALGGAPAELEPRKLPPIQYSDVCWKPGGSGGCPDDGYVDAGLQCVKGDSWDAAFAVTSQVLSVATSVVKFIPGVKQILDVGVGKFKGFVMKLLGKGDDAKKAARLAKMNAQVKSMKAFADAAKKHKKQKTKWEKAMKLRQQGGMIFKTRRTVEDTTALASSANSTTMNAWKTAHTILDVLSFDPGPLGSGAEILRQFGNPECRY